VSVPAEEVLRKLDLRSGSRRAMRSPRPDPAAVEWGCPDLVDTFERTDLGCPPP